MKTGTIQSLIDVLEQAFCNLNLDIPAEELEDLAITIHKAMSVEGRHYHTPEHVLSLSDSNNPIQSLAAFFHDIVYYQVDRGFSSEVMDIISPYIGFDPRNESEMFLVSQARPDDLCFRVTLDIFNFTAGQKLYDAPGFNEFLSALVMGKKLHPLLPEKILLQIIVYIEATIPFRGKNEFGVGPFETLEARLKKACRDHQIPMTQDEIVQTIQGAVVFANKDVENFSEKDPAMFLCNTWKLLPENNLALRSGQIYSVRDYRQALQRTDKHLDIIKPESIFHSYKGVPPNEEYLERLSYARKNIETARAYLGVKLLNIAILEALADVTGGDAPLSLFMGDVGHNGDDARRLENILPPVQLHPTVDPNSILYELLESGRGAPADFNDLKNAPLSLFLYQSLGPERVQYYLQYAREMFDGDLQPEKFLETIDAGILSTIAEVCARMVLTRSEKLLRYVKK